jgi:excisionase family DNA binding protein
VLCSGVRRILVPSSRLSLMALRSPMRAPWSPEWTRRRTACLVALRDAGRRNRAVSLLRPAGPMMSVNPAKPTPLEDKFVLTSEEAAEFLGVSLRTIRYWVAARRIAYFHLGRFIRFKPGRPDGFLGVWSRRTPRAPTDDFNCFDRAWAERRGAPSDCQGRYGVSWLGEHSEQFGNCHPGGGTQDSAIETASRRARRRHLQRKQTPADGSPEPRRTLSAESSWTRCSGK